MSIFHICHLAGIQVHLEGKSLKVELPRQRIYAFCILTDTKLPSLGVYCDNFYSHQLYVRGPFPAQFYQQNRYSNFQTLVILIGQK